MDTNAVGSSAAEVSDEKIAAFSAAENAAFALAEAMTATPAGVSDDVFETARQCVSDAQLVELTATAAMENYRARFNRAFAVESQHFYHPTREKRSQHKQMPGQTIRRSRWR